MEFCSYCEASHALYAVRFDNQGGSHQVHQSTPCRAIDGIVDDFCSKTSPVLGFQLSYTIAITTKKQLTPPFSEDQE
jgi:hypothetical protein